MKSVFDMSTGRMVETVTTSDNPEWRDFDATAKELQLQLQPVTIESLPKRGIPPELVLADPNAFLEKMR
jgi:hypothetical protein